MYPINMAQPDITEKIMRQLENDALPEIYIT